MAYQKLIAVQSVWMFAQFQLCFLLFDVCDSDELLILLKWLINDYIFCHNYLRQKMSFYEE